MSTVSRKYKWPTKRSQRIKDAAGHIQAREATFYETNSNEHMSHGDSSSGPCDTPESRPSRPLGQQNYWRMNLQVDRDSSPYRGPSPSADDDSPGRTIRQILCACLFLYVLFSTCISPFLPIGSHLSNDSLLRDPEQLAKEAPREPLGVFDDFSAIYRAWGQFATTPRLKYDQSFLQTISPIFSDLIALGDTWDIVSGTFSNSSSVSKSEYESSALGSPNGRNETHVSLLRLERIIDRGMDDMTLWFKQGSYGNRHRRGWADRLKSRIMTTKLLVGAEIRSPQSHTIEDCDDPGDGHKSPVWMLYMLQGLPRVTDSAVYNPSNELQGGIDLGDRLHRLLENLELLQRITAHASASHLRAARDGHDWLYFPVLQRASLLFHERSHLFRAITNADHVSAISRERLWVLAMIEHVMTLLKELDPIISCEKVVMKQVQELISAVGDIETRNDVNAPYRWIPGQLSWLSKAPADNNTWLVTTEIYENGAGHSGFPIPRSIPECAALHGSSNGLQQQPRGNTSEHVVLYIPPPRYLYDLFESNLQWVDRYQNMLTAVTHESGSSW